MPTVTITLRKPKPPGFKAKVLAAVHDSLVASGVSPNDRFHRVLELDAENFQFDPTFPDLQRPRTDEFVLVEVLLGVGRSVKVKKAILSGLMDRLASEGFDTENFMVIFQETAWENWSPAGGRTPHA
jgi:phenylpyruvate tautomerase PptA (4-oxalocrotonate tautomerase family)